MKKLIPFFICFLFVILSEGQTSKHEEKFAFQVINLSDHSISRILVEFEKDYSIKIFGYCSTQNLFFASADLNIINEDKIIEAVKTVQEDANVRLKTGKFDEIVEVCPEMRKLLLKVK
ncbi:MAG: hypothetical protein ACK452_04120 [Bacteroidota bacterium]